MKTETMFFFLANLRLSEYPKPAPRQDRELKKKNCDWLLVMKCLIKFTQKSIAILEIKIAFSMPLPS